MTERSVVHSTFTIERTYDAAPAQVFAAFADPAAQDRWAVQHRDRPIAEVRHDFRVGGQESGRFSLDDTTIVTSETLYQDIVPDQRIIYAYTMAIDDVRISASLAVIELEPAGMGTRFVYTEHAAFLDGRDTPSVREEGCRTLFDRLEAELRRSA